MNYSYPLNSSEHQPFLKSGNVQSDFESFLQQNEYDYANLISDDQQYSKEPAIQESTSERVVEVIHNVTVDDTLEGLSLQYGVSQNVIKTHNNLTSDFIYLLKQIRIPNPKDYYENQGPKNNESTLHQLSIQYFVCAILKGGDKCEKVARYYLEDHNWDMESAAKEYESDLKFEERHKKLEDITQPQQKTQQKKQNKVGMTDNTFNPYKNNPKKDTGKIKAE